MVRSWGVKDEVPKLLVDAHLIYQNTMAVVDVCRKAGLEVFGVTKGVGGLPAVARAMLAGGVVGIADSRLANLERLRSSGIGAPLMLLRSPTMGEISRVAALVDILLCSSLPTINALSKAAIKQRREVQAILMVEMGDRREGIMPDELGDVLGTAEKLPGIRVRGLGTNLACLAGAMPTASGMTYLGDLANELGPGKAAPWTISAGNSSALGLIYEGKWPNLSLPAHLRIGESILLGWDVMTKKPLPGTSQAAFRLFAEVIEAARKPSLPGGPTGCNAFDEEIQPLDRGTHRRAILALGRQDLGSGKVMPIDPGIEVVGMTSDHTVLAIDEAKSAIRPGTQLEFRLDYGGLLAAMTSPYVGKIIKD
jgi:predicted amino acid racemase